MSNVIKYRKKPVVIEAMEWDGDVRIGHPVARWIVVNGGEYNWSPTWPSRPKQKLVIVTPEGNMHAEPGDFIIKGVQGEFYPCKPDIFAESYERVIITGQKDV